MLIDPWDLLSMQSSDTDQGSKWFLDGAKMKQLHAGVVERFTERAEVEVVRDFSTNHLAGLPDSHFDWVYIDAAHEYQPVKDELAMCVKKLKVGGLVTGDDFFKSVGDRLEVREAVLDSLEEWGLPRKLRVLDLENLPESVDQPSRVGQQFILPVTAAMKEAIN